MIVALLFFHGDNPYETAQAQAISVSVGGALQLGWLMLACRRSGVSLRLRRPRLTPEMRQLMTLILPAAAGAGARSEEHTSELQSLMRISYAVFCLKKKIK